MESNKFKLNKTKFIQITLLLLAFLLIFFTYFLNLKKKQPSTSVDQIEAIKPDGQKEKVSNTFLDVEYSGFDKNGNRFVIGSETAQFEIERPNVIRMQEVLCTFYLENGEMTVRSRFAIYNNVTDDMEFIEDVKIKFLENVLFSQTAHFLNLQNKLLIKGNVKGHSPQGTLEADKLDFNLDGPGKLKISMTTDEKVNIKINY